MSTASSEADGNISLSFFGFVEGKLSSIVWATELLIESTSAWVGLPVTYMTLSNWLRVEVPGKTGLPRRSSAKIHPTLHKSALLVYWFEPSKISGALYHLVAT